MTDRTQIEDTIDRLCELDDQYTRRFRLGKLTPATKNYIVDRISELQSTLWQMDLNHDDLKWFSNRPIYGTNAIGDPYYIEDLS